MARASNLRINVTSDSRQARQDLQGVEQTAMSSMSKLSGSLPGIAAGVGAAIAGGIAAGFAVTLDQGKIKTKLAAQLDATGPEAERIGKAAGRLFAGGIATDFQQAADTIRATMSSGLLPTGATDAQINKLSRGLNDLAVTFDEDAGKISTSASVLLRTGLAATADQALDTITRAFQKFGPQADDLLDTVTEYGVQFAKLGLDGPRALGLLNQGLAAGARNADLVADAVKEFTLLGVAGTKAVTDGYKAVGLDADKARAAIAAGGPAAAETFQKVLDGLRQIEDPLDRNNAATALFGTKWEDLGQALFALDPAKAVDSLGAVEGATAKLGETLRSTTSQELTQFWRTLQQVVVDFIAGKVIPVMTELWGFIKDAFGPAVAELARIWDTTLAPALAKVWRMVKDDLVPILRDQMLTAVNRVREAVSSMADAFRDSEAAQLAAKAVMLVLEGLMSGPLLVAVHTATTAIEFLAKSFRFALDQADRLIRSVRDLVGWLNRVTGPLQSLSGFNFGDLVPDFLQRSSLSAQRGATGFASTRAASAALPVFRASIAAPNVTVILDGTPVRGMIQRTVTSALQAEGARYSVGGWA